MRKLTVIVVTLGGLLVADHTASIAQTKTKPTQGIGAVNKPTGVKNGVRIGNDIKKRTPAEVKKTEGSTRRNLRDKEPPIIIYVPKKKPIE